MLSLNISDFDSVGNVMSIDLNGRWLRFKFEIPKVLKLRLPIAALINILALFRDMSPFSCK